jgi:hypothetical protein
VIIYFHGFGGSGNSSKADALREAGLEVISPDLPMDPLEVENLVYNIVKDHAPKKGSNYKIIFMGTSLGGFYAAYFSACYDSSAILINPAIEPSESLKSRLGLNQRSEHPYQIFMVTEDHLNKFKVMEDYIEAELNGHFIHLFLAKDDEVLDANKTLRHFPYVKSSTVTEDGGHKMDKHTSLIVGKALELSKE